MITIKILLSIITVCATQIDPDYDVDVCATKMVNCALESKTSFDYCTDLYEPSQDDTQFGGQPKEADWSY